VTTSKVRHPPADGVSARTGTALERAQPAQIELFARKKSRRFIVASKIVSNANMVATNIMAVICCVCLHLMEEAEAHRVVEALQILAPGTGDAGNPGSGNG